MDEAEYIDYMYNFTLYDPYYKRLLNSSTKIVGMWDDHDYGLNDGDQSCDTKHLTRSAFMDFIGEP